MISLSITVGFAFVAGSIATSSAAQVPTDTLPEAQRVRIDSIFAANVDTAGPGCVLGVFRHGDVLYARAAGLADLGHRVAIARASRFHLASMTKQFTAAAVMLLVERGLVGLDDDVRRYLPQVPDFGTPITIRQLLNHTSGLRDVSTVIQLADWPGAVTDGDELFTARDFWAFLGRQQDLNFAPGSDWHYSNTGYTLLGFVVEQVAGVTLRAFLDREVFQPLGMTSTVLLDDHTEVLPDLVTGYARRGGRWRAAVVNADVVGQSGMISTLDDLAKWHRNFTTHQVGSPTLFAAMAAPTRLADGRVAGYGFGVVTGEIGGYRTIAHSGGLVGHSTEMLRVPEVGIAVAALCNRPAPEASEMVDRVVRTVLGDPRSEAADRPASPDRADPDLVGVYVSELTDRWLRVERTPEGLSQAEAGRALVPLQRVAEMQYRVGDVSWRFSRRGDTAEVVVDPHGLPPATVFRRVTPAGGSTAGLAGSYWSAELEHPVMVGVEDSTVTIRLTANHSLIRLTEAYPNGWVAGPVTVHFQRSDDSGRAEALTLTLFGVRKLRYERR